MMRIDEVEISRNGVPRFEIPGWRDRMNVEAGVTGRGDLNDPFDLSIGGDQPVRRALDRWRAFANTLPEFRAAIIGRQVHGTVVLTHAEARGLVILDGADGHVTTTAGLLLTVSLADCVPIYLVDPVRSAIALLHSGWKGTAGGILEAAIQALERRAGTLASDIVMHCGVGICGSCYKVGPEVASACGRPPVAGSLDLRAVIADQALRLGVRQVSVSGHCSAHDRDRFFSHRASGGADGRMVAYLGLVEPSPRSAAAR